MGIFDALSTCPDIFNGHWTLVPKMAGSFAPQYMVQREISTSPLFLNGSLKTAGEK